MNDRITVAEAMGWTVEEKDRLYDNYSEMLNGRYGHLPHMSVGVLIPDPFTDANDDYAVLEWMRNEKRHIEFHDANKCNGWNYQIGDYARAALKVLDND